MSRHEDYQSIDGSSELLLPRGRENSKESCSTIFRAPPLLVSGALFTLLALLGATVLLTAMSSREAPSVTPLSSAERAPSLDRATSAIASSSTPDFLDADISRVTPAAEAFETTLTSLLRRLQRHAGQTALQLHGLLGNASLSRLEAATDEETGAPYSHEHLKKLRIDVRQIRSLLRYSQSVLPHRESKEFRNEGFGLLQKKTGDARDMDVVMEQWQQRVADVGDEQQRRLLRPLLEFAQRQQIVHQADLCEYLDSREFRMTITDFASFLRHAGERAASDEPIVDLASRDIWAAFRCVRARGANVTRDTPHKQVHALRKRFKDLRALIECFGQLYNQDEMESKLLPQLKSIQDNLGDIQDSVVWVTLLDDFDKADWALQPTEVQAAVSTLRASIERTQDVARTKFFELFKTFSQTTGEYRRLFAAIPRASHHHGGGDDHHGGEGHHGGDDHHGGEGHHGGDDHHGGEGHHGGDDHHGGEGHHGGDDHHGGEHHHHEDGQKSQEQPEQQQQQQPVEEEDSELDMTPDASCAADD